MGSHFVVKIQIPLLEKWQDVTLIYNRDRSFLKHMAKIHNEKSFEELIEVIKTEGFNGLKGYFHAVLEDVASETIKINTKRILPLSHGDHFTQLQCYFIACFPIVWTQCYVYLYEIVNYFIKFELSYK